MAIGKKVADKIFKATLFCVGDDGTAIALSLFVAIYNK